MLEAKMKEWPNLQHIFTHNEGKQYKGMVQPVLIRDKDNPQSVLQSRSAFDRLRVFSPAEAPAPLKSNGRL